MANYTILLIDYEPRSIERFRDPLVAAGYTVEIATDGVSGIEAFHRLNPDMVLVEAMIPKKHGFEVCQELKRTPHGRRTPVLITTGVYKGRKYRTQALHIYGCDEYIEKPIAPEQLLEVVGKFFGSGANASAPRAAQPAPIATERVDERPSRVDGPATSRAAAPTDAPIPKVERSKPTPVPKSSVADDTEDEIMARLDAILPDGGIAPQIVAPSPIAMVATIEPPEDMPIEFEPAAQVLEQAEEMDPFAQMRAELDAELGSLSAALAVELSPNVEPQADPFPSDQAVAPSVLEALPAPDAGALADVEAAPAEAPAVKSEKPGQVVNFDSKRSRKNKKSGKPGKDRSQQVAALPPAPMAAPTPAPTPIKPAAAETHRAAREISVPSGTLVASALEPSTARRGMPVWMWGAVALVIVGATYFALSRGGAKTTTPPPAAAPVETASNAPAETNTTSDTATQPAQNAPEVANAPVVTPPRAPELQVAAPEVKKPAPNVPKAAIAKKAPDTVPPAPTATSAAASPKPPPKPKPIAQAKPAPQESVSQLVAEDSVAGVEALPDAAAVAPAASVAPGTLVAIDEADVMPVTLQHKLPVYSLQARQMRLAGTVVMNVLVNENGSVDQVVLVSGVPGADVNEAAMKAAKSWTYRPATKLGVPVKVWKSEQVVFKP